jgi:thymidylate synthase
MEFNLRNGFPLLTTKKVFWRGIVSELIWFLRGETDATILSQKGVRIWDANTSRAALDARGLHSYGEGDAGPVYGFQWRHWGAAYDGPGGPQKEYGGHDQLVNLIRGLREQPFSRRHIVSAWNVEDLDTMALPPCHILFQCYVNNDDTLDIQVYQRSVDIGLGLPFNIASYSLLNHLICYLTGYVPGRLIMSLGDAHIYRDHIDEMKTQMARTPRCPPKVLIKKNTYTRLDEFTEGDIRLVGYEPHPPIRMSMST